ncbi:MAG: hypothetical protein AB1779_00115 [Candidatus Thermoplasmatota archaeon]
MVKNDGNRKKMKIPEKYKFGFGDIWSGIPPKSKLAFIMVIVSLIGILCLTIPLELKIELPTFFLGIAGSLFLFIGITGFLISVKRSESFIFFVLAAMFGYMIPTGLLLGTLAYDIFQFFPLVIIAIVLMTVGICGLAPLIYIRLNRITKRLEALVNQFNEDLGCLRHVDDKNDKH